MHYAHAYKQAASAALLAEFTSDEVGGSMLDNVPNAAGKTPKEVAGLGSSILPETHEALVYVPRVPKKSLSLTVSAGM
jgi:hypothetical protein